MYNISIKTKNNLERFLGIQLEVLGTMSADEERQWVEKRIGKKLKFSRKRKRGNIGRGNPLLSRRKIRTSEDSQSKINKYYGI